MSAPSLAGMLQGERVLILGGSGWFGRTLLSLLNTSQARVVATASTARDTFVVWDQAAVESFAPTVVVNLAFRTRERLALDGLEAFEAANRALVNQFLLSGRQPSVRAVVTVSSGAAITEPDEPYGRLKALEEQAAQSLVSPGRDVVVGRAYSVSGPFVRRPEDYALSNMVLQARGGHIQVLADCPTYRRYVSVADFLSVCLLTSLGGRSGVIESGGELVEMGDLAARVAGVVNPSATMSRALPVSDAPSTYASDDTSWRAACEELGFVAADLIQQIREVDAGL